MCAHNDEWGRRAGRIDGEDGFTLVELLVAAMVMMIVLFATTPLLLTAMNQTENQSDRVVALDTARNGILRMTSEIRSAAALQSVSSQVLDILVYFPEDTANPYHWIRYKCVGNDQGNSTGLGGHCSRQDKTTSPGSDCTSNGTGDGCVIFISDVVKHTTDSFGEACENYDPASNEEKHFCIRDSKTVEISLFVEVPDTYVDDPARDEIELRSSVTIRNCLEQDEPVVCDSPT